MGRKGRDRVKTFFSASVEPASEPPQACWAHTSPAGVLNAGITGSEAATSSGICQGYLHPPALSVCPPHSSLEL